MVEAADPCVVCLKPVAAGEGAHAMPPFFPAMHTRCLYTVTSEDLKIVVVLGEKAMAEMRAGVEMFMNRPDRWWASPTWRCANGHVSKVYLKSEERGALCLACGKRLHLTFPEDVEGPLPS